VCPEILDCHCSKEKCIRHKPTSPIPNIPNIQSNRFVANKKNSPNFKTFFLNQNYGHHPAQYPAYPPPYSPAQPAAYPAQGYPAPYPAGQYCPGGQCPTQQNVM
jgi:hypothetical protein